MKKNKASKMQFNQMTASQKGLYGLGLYAVSQFAVACVWALYRELKAARS